MIPALSFVIKTAAAFALVVTVEALMGPFGTPWDGLLGIGVGVGWLLLVLAR